MVQLANVSMDLLEIHFRVENAYQILALRIIHANYLKNVLVADVGKDVAALAVGSGHFVLTQLINVPACRSMLEIQL